MPPLLLENALHLGVTLAGGVLLLALLHLQERTTSRFIAHRLGWRGVMLTGWLGVPVHELSHLLAARLFGHRIIAWKLFEPDPVSGTLGYVRHAYARRSPWQLLGNLFIGLAPLAAGAALLLALLAWLVTPAALLELWEQARLVTRDPVGPLGLAAGLKGLALTILQAVWRRRGPLLPLQLYLGVCVASHMAPSRADLSGALGGGLVAGLALALLAGVGGYLGLSLEGIEGGLLALTLLILLTGLFQAGYAVVVGLCERLTNRIRFRDTV